jgi:hypothetical protein
LMSQLAINSKDIKIDSTEVKVKKMAICWPLQTRRKKELKITRRRRPTLALLIPSRVAHQPLPIDLLNVPNLIERPSE